MLERLRLFTLGGLWVWLGDRPLTGFETRKVEALLVYLACNRRPQSREVLADLLWEKRSQPQAQNNLRVTLASLRKQLGDLLIADHASIALDPQAEMWVDALELEDALSAWRATPGIVSRQAAERLAQAIDLYQGEFLQGFFVHENHSFEEWMTRERQRLHLLVADALGDLIDYEIQNQAYPAGLEHTERLVALDPLDEAARCRMMRLLAGNGRRGEALAQYESLRRSLADELGVEPATGTRALYEQIRAGELESLPAAQKQLLG